VQQKLAGTSALYSTME